MYQKYRILVCDSFQRDSHTAEEDDWNNSSGSKPLSKFIQIREVHGTHYQTCASKNWTKTTILEYLGPKDTMIEFT